MKFTSIFSILSISTYAMATEEVGVNKESEFKESIPEEFHGSWQKWHMKVEHELDDADAVAVFKLHDTRNINKLSASDILRMYGLQRSEVVGEGNGMGSHDDTEKISQQLKNKVVSKVMELIDKDHDNEISLKEWEDFSGKGGEFPDFGLGSGHEYDFEDEYEKHHWLKYHQENDPDVNIQHAEDIAHELLHHFHEIEHEQQPDGYNVKSPLLMQNVPGSYLI